MIEVKWMNNNCILYLSIFINTCFIYFFYFYSFYLHIQNFISLSFFLSRITFSIHFSLNHLLTIFFIFIAVKFFYFTFIFANCHILFRFCYLSFRFLTSQWRDVRLMKLSIWSLMLRRNDVYDFIHQKKNKKINTRSQTKNKNSYTKNQNWKITRKAFRKIVFVFERQKKRQQSLTKQVKMNIFW